MTKYNIFYRLHNPYYVLRIPSCNNFSLYKIIFLSHTLAKESTKN